VHRFQNVRSNRLTTLYALHPVCAELDFLGWFSSIVIAYGGASTRCIGLRRLGINNFVFSFGRLIFFFANPITVDGCRFEYAYVGDLHHCQSKRTACCRDDKCRYARRLRRRRRRTPKTGRVGHIPINLHISSRYRLYKNLEA